MSTTFSNLDYTIKSIRSSGPGGQHANKVSTAIQLSFDIAASSLPQNVKDALLRRADRRITEQGILIITARKHRSQLKNKKDAIKKLYQIIHQASVPKKVRIRTKKSKAAREKRLKEKARHSEKKRLRGKVDF